ncbi:winged helix-turn-helix domain-containing protein [Aeromicrobium sp. CTD01-1L150]|uniref:winged helix-turn-helix domain-containing protein n=1 Tax=Aeromicrobium sp. CTD01-1L150 TaxID=3341830 RepID=UPI0035C26284
MPRATDQPPSERMRAITDARTWAARSQGRERVVIIEPDQDDVETVAAALVRRGVPAVGFTSPWRALACLGREEPAVVLVSCRLGARALREIVEAVRDEMNLPVLIAYRPDDTDAIGPAVLAGGRPLVALPYDIGHMVEVVSEALPGLPPPACLEFGRLSVVPEWQDAHVDGIGLDLSPLEFCILVELVRRGGRAASRETLVSVAWPDRPADPKGLLTAAVKRIRHKFDALDVSEAVETVRGVGYRLNAVALGESRRLPGSHGRAV